LERDVLRTLAAAHQVRHLVYFFEAIHALAQTELIPMLLGAELGIGPNPQPAQGLSA
jgi:hypothetical protein